jgi:hypothetical protein
LIESCFGGLDGDATINYATRLTIVIDVYYYYEYESDLIIIKQPDNHQLPHYFLNDICSHFSFHHDRPQHFDSMPFVLKMALRDDFEVIGSLLFED